MTTIRFLERGLALLDRLRFGERDPYGLGNVPRHVQMESRALLRSDGYVILSNEGTLPPAIVDKVDLATADLVMRTVWSRLDETFHRSTLLRRWHPLRIMAMTQGSLEVNGSAGQVTDMRAPYFYIGLHAGLFIHTADRLLRVLADPRSLPEVGNVEVEQQGRTGTLLGVLPNDPSRRQCAIDLTTLALMAVFAHEVGHIVRGHLWLLRTRFGVSRLYEVGTPNADSSSETRQQSLRRAMELDADIFAGKFLGTLLFNTKSSGWYDAFGNDQRNLLRMLALSTTCTFRAFDDQSSSTYYHTPFMRAQLLTMSAKHMARQDIPFELDDFRESAWLPEVLKVLRSPSDKLDNEALRRDYDAMLKTLEVVQGLRDELDRVHAEMDATF
jgi:hypothetical protein